MHPRLPQISGKTVAATLALTVSACTSLPQSAADLAELGNMDSEHFEPKSSPRQLVSTFATVCLDGPRDLASAENALRSAGFVPQARQSGQPVVFVSDDRRPAVVIAPQTGNCAVRAEARTGQTNAIASMVAQRFPQANVVDPQTLGGGVEQAWNVPEGLIFTSRSGSVGYHSRLMLGILRIN